MSATPHLLDDGPTATERFIRGILPENPTFRQMLGMCPVLAVTGNVYAALGMAVSTTFVMIASNVLTSMLRSLIKPHLRILIFITIIAVFVAMIDLLLKAFSPTLSKELGAYIPLIVTNCLVMCRCEVCAVKQGVLTSASDALGQGIGFGLGLSAVAVVREILSTGGLFGWCLPESLWPRWNAMAMAPGAFIAFGLLVALIAWIQFRSKQRN
jgi:electron transport complex protein RnfE